jgi:hypothetical protein
VVRTFDDTDHRLGAEGRFGPSDAVAGLLFVSQAMVSIGSALPSARPLDSSSPAEAASTRAWRFTEQILHRCAVDYCRVDDGCGPRDGTAASVFRLSRALTDRGAKRWGALGGGRASGGARGVKPTRVGGQDRAVDALEFHGRFEAEFVDEAGA